MTSTSPSKRLVIFCDGSWCGRETQVSGAPPSNIRMLANMVGDVEFTKDAAPTKVHPINTTNSSVTAGYQEGIGVNKTFLEYLWDGATASTIGEECVSVYQFIVENYTADHDIWMFGLSRGAYTVRCIGGMINNCGIIKAEGLSPSEISTMCHEIYKTYRSPLDIDRPNSDRCKSFRKNKDRVWPVARPIRFMGLFDTVGSLGIPRVNAGVGFDWPEFYDQRVSSVVQDVYHATSLHDRLWAFEPCLAFESASASAGDVKTENGVAKTQNGDAKMENGEVKTENGEVKAQNGEAKTQNGDAKMENGEVKAQNGEAQTGYGEAQTDKVKAKIHQKWFPGTHYDLGRQTFRFIRQAPSNEIEKLLGALPDLLSRTIYPNQVLSDLVLRWILQSVQTVNTSTPIIPDVIGEIKAINARLASPPKNHTGSGDIYGNALAYGPVGTIFSTLQKFGSKTISLLNVVWPQLGDNIQDLLGIKTILRILTAVRDRRIPGDDADVYDYKKKDEVTVYGEAEATTIEAAYTIEVQAKIAGKNENRMDRYPSRTFESRKVWEKVFGLNLGT
jgi:uncharacterized protein (DUF2235 family)